MNTLRRAVAFLFALALAAGASLAAAQDDPPGRVGRIADLGGGVSWFDAEEGQWTAAERNRPLTTADRISTSIDGRAELRVGSTTLRLSNSSELEVLRLDDQRMVFQLHAGSVAVRLRSREIAEEVELVTAEARLLPQRAGHYRIDRIDDTTLAGVWRGELRLADSANIVGANQRIELTRANRGRELRQTFSRLPDDGFSNWVLAEDSRDERSAANRFVSTEMTGAEELDRHGRWDQHPDYGAVWYPQSVAADWAPYRYGRWSWVRPWGWTWVDDTPWGFAPFHYGRWVHWRNRWGWVPGDYAARPVYAPALVAWVGGTAPGFGVTVRIGGGPVSWLPLAPREYYRPHYRHSPVYVDRVNPGPRERWQRPHDDNPRGGGWGNGSGRWANQAAPGAVTVVPADVLTRRRPVAPAARPVVLDGRNDPAPNIGAIGPQRPQPLPAPLQVQPATPQLPAAQSVPFPGSTGRPDRGDRPERIERIERPAPSGSDRQPWRTQVQPQQGQVQPVAPAPPQMQIQPQQPQAQPQQPLPPPQPVRVQPQAQSAPPAAAPAPAPAAMPMPRAVPVERAGPPSPPPQSAREPAEPRPVVRERNADEDRRQRPGMTPRERQMTP